MLHTKTTGPTKRIKELPVALSIEASISGKDWIAAGLGLCETLGDEGRSYVLPNLSGDFQTGRPGPLSYQASAALSKRIYSELNIPVWHDSKGWMDGTQKLLPAEVIGAFTEHGPRSWMNAVLVELEIEKSRRDFLGRWSPTGSDDYSRSFKSIVKSLQEKAIQCIRARDSRLDESDISERLLRYCEDCEIERGKVAVAEFEANLKSFELEMKKAAELNFVFIETPLHSDSLAASTELQTASEELAKVSRRQLSRLNRGRDARFLIVYSNNRRFARLHRTDSSCQWVVTHVKDCQEFDEVQEHQYNARCRNCFTQIDSDTSCTDDYNESNIL